MVAYRVETAGAGAGMVVPRCQPLAPANPAACPCGGEAVVRFAAIYKIASASLTAIPLVHC